MSLASCPCAPAQDSSSPTLVRVMPEGCLPVHAFSLQITTL